MASESTELPLERQSTAEQVASRLRTMIFAGELGAGERLREVPLARSFGVSRPTLRQAIGQLATEGLVHHQMHHGAVVASLTAEDLTDLYRVRRMLELEAVRRAPVDDGALAPLRATVEAMEQALADGDHAAIVEHDRRFHTALVALLGSPRLDRFFSQISAEIRFALGILTTEDQRELDAGRQAGSEAELDEEVVAEHRRLYDRIRDGRDVYHMLEAHLDRAERRLKAILLERERLHAEETA